MTRLLTVDAPWDMPTVYLASWMDSLVAEARRIGVQVLSLRGYEVNESNLIGAIDSFQPEYVMLGGHGGPAVFTAANLVPLLVACQNDQILSGRSVYFISCLTGQQLVPSAVSKTAVGAAGFTSEFTWVISPPYIPDQDPYAKPFERLVVEPALELLRGRGYRGWYDRLQRVAREEEAAWNQSTDPLAAQVVLFLRQNAGSATFVSTTEGMPRLDLPTLMIGGYILKALLG